MPPKKGALVAAGVELVLPKQGWRHSARQKENESGPVLDDETRMRLKRSSLDSLEKDNFAVELYMENLVSQECHSMADKDKKNKKSKKTGPAETLKCKPFATALAEAMLDRVPDHIPTYINVGALPSRFPPRHFCSVCGYEAKLTCVKCGFKICTKACNSIHIETRCQKKVA